MANDIDAKRIKHLYDLLGKHHEKLAMVEQELVTASPGEGRAIIRLQIKDIWDEIHEREGELAELLARNADVNKIPVDEAGQVLADLQTQVVQLKAADKADWPSDILAKLDDLKVKLEEPGKAATAKLKVSLPIVPLLVSYELKLDTESTLVQVWRKITGLFRKAVPDPT